LNKLEMNWYFCPRRIWTRFREIGAQNQSNLDKSTYLMRHSAHPRKHSLGVKLASLMFYFHMETV